MKAIKTIDQKEINGIIDYLAHKITHQSWRPDIIVTMAKGGLIPSRLLAKKLGINRILSYGISFYDDYDQKVDVPIVYQDLKSSKRLLMDKNILLVDDIADTGDSLIYCIDHLIELNVGRDNIKTCSLFKKRGSRIIPTFYFSDVENDVWVVMPWE